MVKEKINLKCNDNFNSLENLLSINYINSFIAVENISDIITKEAWIPIG